MKIFDMFAPKITVRKGLYEELRKAADAGGYSSVDELIVHVLEKAADEARDTIAEDEVKKRLKGLGYLG